MLIKVETEAKNIIRLNPAQICWIDETKVTMSNGLTVALTEAGLRALDEAIAPKDRQTKPDVVNGELLELFEQLHKLTGGRGKPVFSLQREKKLKDLLGKHRMTRELLIKAATNIGKDAFLQGENDSHKRYGDVDYLLRPDKAAKWAEDQEEKKKGMF